MKTIYSTLFLGLVVVCLFIRAQRIDPTPETKIQAADTTVVYTADVRAIIDQKCFGCHNPEAKNEKARKKLMWDDLPKLAIAKQLKTMNDMLEVLSEGKMPPAKFLEFKPEAKLTEAEAKILKNWSEANAKKLLK